MLTGLAACLGLPVGPVLRWRIRQDKGIKGSMIMDSLCWIMCGYCALTQESLEVGWSSPIGGGASGGGAAKTEDMTRQ